MGIFDRVERKLDRVINGAFARAFKAEVQPVEIAAAMRRAMDERAAVVGKGRTLVPNVFSIELDPSDYDRLTQYEDVLAQELIASVEEHVESQRYTAGGPLAVEFTRSDDLDTGVFRVRPTTAASATPRRREPSADSSPSGSSSSGASSRGSSPSQRRFDARRTDKAEPAPVHRPRNLPFPPEATAHADGAIGIAGSAATAAAGAAAGTAAAGRAGSYLARHEVAADVEARERAERPDADSRAAGRDPERAASRNPEQFDEGLERSGDAPAAGSARHTEAPPEARKPMRLYAHDDYDAGWDEAWDTDSAADSVSDDAGARAPADAAPARPHAAVDRAPDMPVRRDDDATRVHAVAPPPLPDPAHRPWIELDGDTYPLLAAITVLGRDTAADITLDDPGVSRRHAEIRVTHDGPHLVVGLRDLGSTNGTFVNGERITSQRLDDGDRVTMGRVSFVIRTRRR